MYSVRDRKEIGMTGVSQMWSKLECVRKYPLPQV